MIQRNYDKLVGIVKAGLEEAFIKKAREAGALGLTVIPARGTVSNEMLNMLGLERRQYTVIEMLAPAEQTLMTIGTLAAQFQMEKPGHGIIFSIPAIRGKGVAAMFRLRDDYRQKMGLSPVPLPEIANSKKSEEISMLYEYELLHIIVKSGYADEAMDAAKAAGAQGGTIIHGRGIGIRENTKLFGVAIEPEKDILMVLVKQEESAAIMAAITEKVGLDKPGHGIAFAMPVGCTMGIAHAQQEK